MTKKNRRIHPEEFKSEAVRLARSSGKPVAQIARDLGIAGGLLHCWIKKHEEAESKGTSAEDLKREKEDLARLRKEIRTLKEENEILKKAAAYFARESK